jgi:hypothetical protein
MQETEGKTELLVIGVDISTGKDYSCISSKCVNCNWLLSSKLFDPSEEPYVPYHKKCPRCGVRFKTYIFPQ